jgi:23S rRNA (uracil1939-C5)-methyltransferase
VEVAKTKKTFVEATLLEVTKPSRHRHEAREEHFRLCSPWQGVEYGYQLELKRGMLAEIFGRPELELEVKGLVAAPEQFGYRNKLEFGLATREDGRLELAFHARGSETHMVPLPRGCVLGSAAINTAALAMVEQLNQLEIGEGASLMIRESHTDGKILAVVGLGRRIKRDWGRLQIPEATGVVVSQVRPGHAHERLWEAGETNLQERVGGVDLRYPFDGFFQTNVPAFEHALERILAAVPAKARVVDLYGGVGAIGLPVAKIARSVVGVEINGGAAEQAAANAARAGLTNYEALALPAERLPVEALKGSEVVIVDPPRAGLDRRVVAALLETAPKRIIYLSCNPVTQARDIMMLAEKYRAGAVTGFDFYPGTLHVESLIVLECKA